MSNTKRTGKSWRVTKVDTHKSFLGEEKLYKKRTSQEVTRGDRHIDVTAELLFSLCTVKYRWLTQSPKLNPAKQVCGPVKTKLKAKYPQRAAVNDVRASLVRNLSLVILDGYKLQVTTD